MLRQVGRFAFQALRALIVPALALFLVASHPASAQTTSPLSGGQWETIANGDNIWALAKEGPTTLWAGTRGGGAVKWDISDMGHPTYQQYLYPQTGLPSNEVRSIAVKSGFQGQGLGQAVVLALVEEARRLGIPTVFCLTRAVPFFARLGFAVTERDRFPRKVWKDCIHCPVFANCDEVAMALPVTRE